MSVGCGGIEQSLNLVILVSSQSVKEKTRKKI